MSEMISEEDKWAIKYGEERKRRMDAETRVMAFMHEVPALCDAVAKFVTLFCDPHVNLHQQLDQLQKMVCYMADCEVILNYCLGDPSWPLPKELTDMIEDTIEKGEELPDKYMDWIWKRLHQATKTVRSKWTRWCDERNLNNPSDLSKSVQIEFLKLIKARIEHDANLENCEECKKSDTPIVSVEKMH